jgi:hypothetical protein
MATRCTVEGSVANSAKSRSSRQQRRAWSSVGVALRAPSRGKSKIRAHVHIGINGYLQLAPGIPPKSSSDVLFLYLLPHPPLIRQVLLWGMDGVVPDVPPQHGFRSGRVSTMRRTRWWSTEIINAGGENHPVRRLKGVFAAGLRGSRLRSMHKMTPCGHQERWNPWRKLAMNSATGFLMDLRGLRSTHRERKETIRFSDAQSLQPGLSPIRSVSRIVRRAARSSRPSQ